jgi:hypothetical protein
MANHSRLGDVLGRYLSSSRTSHTIIVSPFPPFLRQSDHSANASTLMALLLSNRLVVGTFCLPLSVKVFEKQL